ILEDIIASINHSDLIVADLTGSNPNVYYELGIAHAFGRPVILLTQSVSDLPFDLRSYRVLQYNTHFSAIEHARNKLKELASVARDGKLVYGNPVIDFGSIKGVETQSTEAEIRRTDDLGFLDHLIRMQDGFAAMSDVINHIGERMNKVSTMTEKVTEEMNRLAASKETEKPRKIQALLGELAITQQEYAAFLKESNDQMESNLDQTFTSLEFVISFKAPATDEERAALTAMLSHLTDLENNSQTSLNTFTILAKTIRGLPKMERNLNKAINEVAIQIERFIGYTQQVVAMSSKSIAIARKLLES
ncbi:MAG: hypothetical protein AB1564_09675, partial [Chloroflexota bacterium]